MPSVQVEKYVHRIAMDLLTKGVLHGEDHGDQQDGQQDGGGQPQQRQRAGAPPRQADPDGAGRGPVVLPEGGARLHPFMVQVALLTGLVIKRGWHLGRTPRTVAGASMCV